MKQFISMVAVVVLCMNGITAYAAENLDKAYIEEKLWSELWHGKGDDGTVYPEASYKHHILDEWLNDNYGSDEYDWSALGELKYEYKRYYKKYIDGWDFNDDENGGWTIITEENSYRFDLQNGMWQMIDQNGATVDSFPPFSTLTEESTKPADGQQISSSGDSNRVIGAVTGDTQTASESVSASQGEVTAVTAPDGSAGESGRSGASALPWILGGVTVVGIGAAGYFIMKKK